MTAFILNLTVTYKKVICAEQILFFFDLNQTTLVNPIRPRLVEQGGTDGHSASLQEVPEHTNSLVANLQHSQRRVTARSLAWLCTLLVLICSGGVIALGLAPMWSALLIAVLSFCSVFAILKVLSKKIRKVTPSYQRVSFETCDPASKINKSKTKEI